MQTEKYTHANDSASIPFKQTILGGTANKTHFACVNTKRPGHKTGERPTTTATNNSLHIHREL